LESKQKWTFSPLRRGSRTNSRKPSFFFFFFFPSRKPRAQSLTGHYGEGGDAPDSPRPSFSFFFFLALLEGGNKHQRPSSGLGRLSATRRTMVPVTSFERNRILPSFSIPAQSRSPVIVLSWLPTASNGRPSSALYFFLPHPSRPDFST